MGSHTKHLKLARNALHPRRTVPERIALCRSELDQAEVAFAEFQKEREAAAEQADDQVEVEVEVERQVEGEGQNRKAKKGSTRKA